MHIYYLNLRGEESKHGLVGPSAKPLIRLTRAIFVFGSSTREGSATKLTELLAEFISLKLSDLRTCFLLVISRRSPYTPRDCPLFPIAWPSTQAAHNMTGCCFKARQRTRDNLLAI